MPDEVTVCLMSPGKLAFCSHALKSVIFDDLNWISGNPLDGDGSRMDKSHNGFVILVCKLFIERLE